MAALRERTVAYAVLFVILALPLLYVLGVLSTVGVQRMLQSAPRSGEGVQADALTALFIGGPIGVVVGGMILGWLSYRLSDRLTTTSIGVVAALLSVGSLWAVIEMTRH